MARKKKLDETVVRLLTEESFGKWHTLYMDNLYNRVEFSEQLLEKKIHTVGTLRSNRGEPLEVRKPPASMKPGDVIARDNGKVMVLAWKDKRVVKAISTKHDNSMEIVQRWKKKGKGEKEEVEKPSCIVAYNSKMSGVDHVDQMLAYYPCTRKSIKWTKKVFFYLTQICVHNSYVLYKSMCKNKKMRLYDFQKKIAESLCGVDDTDSSDSDSDAYEPPAKSPRSDPRSRLKGGFRKHELAVYPATEKTKHPQRECRVCSRNKTRKQTRYHCRGCNVPLCVVPCYQIYHTEKDL